MKEHHVIGPPGTGKTTYVARQAQRAAEKHGVDKVVICSLTRAAAQEAAGRETAVNPDHIGTLHSLAFRALGCPKLVTAKEVKQWNAAHPSLAISASDVTSTTGDEELGIAPAQDLYRKMDVFRAKMVPFSEWPFEVRSFAAKWNSWKSTHGLSDFTDLISRAAEEVPFAPGSPRVMFVDECQDMSALELHLIRGWSFECDDLVLVGDLLQSLYDWRGADSNVMDPEQADNRIILKQSYRVPSAVHRLARNITRGLPGADAEYLPAENAGKVERSKYRYNQPEAWLPEVLELIDAGESVMILTTCGYMLGPAVKVLRDRGIPYHNPYSPTRWSPLADAAGTPTWRRIQAFLRPFQSESSDFVPAWTPQEVRLWTSMLRASVMSGRGRKKQFDELPDDLDTSSLSSTLLSAFEGDALDALFTGNLPWLLEHATARFQKSSQYPMAVLSQIGTESFLEKVGTDRPGWLMLGTVHSVKGGEADNVYLFPDLSPQAYKQSTKPGWSNVGAIKRCFYVGLTRARKRLVLGAGSSGMAVKL